jgi:hypothetical protein
LPANAVGKDFLPGCPIFGTAPSGTWVSLFGLAGLLFAVREGVELNLLGLNIGIDFVSPGLKLPGVGRLRLW